MEFNLLRCHNVVHTLAIPQDNPSQPFNFSVSPDGAQHGTVGFLPDARNFVHYSKVGNQGYLVFSGVFAFAELKPHFAEFCTWLDTSDVAVAFIAGHFNVANAGCQPGMATNQVYHAIKSYATPFPPSTFIVVVFCFCFCFCFGGGRLGEVGWVGVRVT